MMEKYGFGVDIGGTTCKIGLFCMDGTLVEKWEIKTNKADGGSHVLEEVAKAVEGKMKEREITSADVKGIGLDVPGPVRADGLVLQCVNLGWENYPASEILSKRMGMTVKICNDANAAALGEMWQGGGKGYTDVVMVTLGTGVGGAVILGGKIIPGSHGIGGELGHVTIKPEETAVCACGKHGCLEQYASATGVVRVAKNLLAERNKDSVLRKSKELTAKEIFDAAKAGDEVAEAAVEELGNKLGLALAGVSCIIDPEIFVIGGGVSRAGELLLKTVERHFKPETLPAGRLSKFALATLGNDAGMYGCVQMLL